MQGGPSATAEERWFEGMAPLAIGAGCGEAGRGGAGIVSYLAPRGARIAVNDISRGLARRPVA